MIHVTSFSNITLYLFTLLVSIIKACPVHPKIRHVRRKDEKRYVFIS